MMWLILLLFFQLHADDSQYSAFEGRGWEFLQHKILNVQKKKSLEFLPGKLFAVITPPAVGCAFYNFFKPAKYDDTFFVSCMVGTFFCWFLTIVNADRIYRSSSWQATYNDFVKEWPKNKHYTPDCLHNLFEEFYKIYRTCGKDSEQYKQKYLEVAGIVNQALLNRFPPPIEINNYNGYSIVQPAPVYYD